MADTSPFPSTRRGEDRDNIRSSNSEESVVRKEAASLANAAAALRLDSVSEGESPSALVVGAGGGAVAGPVAGPVRKTSAVITRDSAASGTKPSVGATTITTAIISSSSTASSTTSSSSSATTTSGACSMSHSAVGGGAYGYHHSQDDEESAFEKSMDSLENMNPLQFEVLETTV